MLETTKAVFAHFCADKTDFASLGPKQQKRVNCRWNGQTKFANIASAAIAFIIVLIASFVSSLASSGLFWVPMSNMAWQEGWLGWGAIRGWALGCWLDRLDRWRGGEPSGPQRRQ